MAKIIVSIGLTLVFLGVSQMANAQLRPMVYTETTVEAPSSEAFGDWTASETIQAFFAPKASIEAVPGGLYELCFAPDAPAGSCGNDDGRILAIEDGKMLSFTWAMPPYMPEIRPHLTVVQIYFEPEGAESDQTRVRLFHTGFGSSDEWDEGREYFEKVWPSVLENYRNYKADGSSD